MTSYVVAGLAGLVFFTMMIALVCVAIQGDVERIRELLASTHASDNQNQRQNVANTESQKEDRSPRLLHRAQEIPDQKITEDD